MRKGQLRGKQIERAPRLIDPPLCRVDAFFVEQQENAACGTHPASVQQAVCFTLQQPVGLILIGLLAPMSVGDG